MSRFIISIMAICLAFDAVANTEPVVKNIAPTPNAPASASAPAPAPAQITTKKHDWVAENTVKIKREIIRSAIDDMKMLTNLMKINETVEGNRIITNIMKTVDKMRVENLFKTGIFKVFKPIEWIQDDKNPGRIMFAVAVFDKYPELMDEEVKAKLKTIENSCHSLLKERIEKLDLGK